jgi:hypothetical protein
MIPAYVKDDPRDIYLRSSWEFILSVARNPLRRRMGAR